MASLLFVRLTLCLFLASLPGIALTAETPPPGKASPLSGETFPSPQVAQSGRSIAVSEIGLESERSKRILLDVLETIKPDGTVEVIVLDLPGLRQQIENFRQHSSDLQARTASVSDLDRLTTDWEPAFERLEGHQENLDRRVQRIDQALTKIRFLRSLWVATRKSAESQEVSEEVILQIDEVDVAVHAALSTANTQQAAGVRLQSNVASLGQLVESDLERIAATRKVLVSRVFRTDADPIWSGRFWSVLGSDQMGRNFAALRQEFSEASEKVIERQRAKIAVYLAVTLALILAMFSLRRRVSERLSAQPDTEAIVAMLGRPISLGLLLSFVFALLLFAGSIRTLEYALSAVSVVPAILILRKIFAPSLHSALSITLVVFFLENSRLIFFRFPVFSRTLFLLELLVLIVYSVNWLRLSQRNSGFETGASETVFKTLGYGAKAILVASSFALVANVAGYGSLSGLLGRALAFGIYGSAVLYGSCRVLEGGAAIAMSSRPLNRLGMVRQNRALLQRRFSLVVSLAAIALWTRAVLVRLELWPSISKGSVALLSTEVPLPEIQLTLGDVLASFLVFYGAVLLSRFIQFVLSEDIYPRFSVRTGRSSAISTLLHYVLLILGFTFAAIALGFDATRFTLLAGAFGVGIGFGLQTIVNNFISGVILLTEQPVQVGDTIELGEIFGEVQRIGIRSSTVRSFQGAEIIVPNADLISEQVTNWTLSDRKRRVEISLGVAYGNDPARVLELLSRIAAEDENILGDPEPYAIFCGFGESSLDFELRAWTDQFDSFLRVKSALSTKLVRALQDAEIQIPFPQRDVHLRDVVAKNQGTDGAPGASA